MTQPTTGDTSPVERLPGTDAAWRALGDVHDPEIPQISVVDLGIVRRVDVLDNGTAVSVDITPTYSACPATQVIADSVREALDKAFDSVEVSTVLTPPWTTDWITAKGHDDLRGAGIAPPRPVRSGPPPSMVSTIATIDATPSELPHCPQCDSAETERVSQFGSTACKALYRCTSCGEPFDYFKPF